MGHKGIAMTLRYTHLSTDHKQRAVSTLEQFGSKVPAIFPTVHQQRTARDYKLLIFYLCRGGGMVDTTDLKSVGR